MTVAKPLSTMKTQATTVTNEDRKIRNMGIGGLTH